MKSLLKWYQYVFMAKPDDATPVTIVAPTFIEAVNTYHEVTHVEPYSVHCVGRCFLLDSE